MSKVIVDIAGHKPYDVRIATGAIEGLGAALRALDDPQALIITDATVAPHYLKPVKASLEAASYRTFVLTVPAGEEAKSIECAAEIWNAMADCKLNRDSLIIALGGGVVGDLHRLDVHARSTCCAGSHHLAFHGRFFGRRQDRHQP